MQHVHRDHNAIKMHIKACYILGQGDENLILPVYITLRHKASFSLSPHHIPAFSNPDSRLRLLPLLITQTELHKYKNTLGHVLNSHIRI